MARETKKGPADLKVEEKLKNLYKLQTLLSEIDKIRTIRGELPEEVRDLEDEIEGLTTRIENINNEIISLKKEVSERQATIQEHKMNIERFKTQIDNVRNNREYEAINKEIEYKNLEIQLCERHKRDAKERIKELERHIEAALKLTERRKEELQMKQDELGDIIAETEKDEIRLRAKSKEQEQFIEERYLTAYKRIRNNMRNGLAVVTIDRDACGGCFSKIPHQRQMEIKMHKKVIVCEHCGRILVDGDIAGKAADLLKK